MNQEVQCHEIRKSHGIPAEHKNNYIACDWCVLCVADRGELTTTGGSKALTGTSAGSETSASVASSPATHQAPSPAVPSPDVSTAGQGAGSEPRT